MSPSEKQFSMYFKDVDVSKSEWTRNPFASNNVSRLTTCKPQEVLDISSDSSLKDMFDADKLPRVWPLVRND
jgi:hypothetical protein